MLTDKQVAGLRAYLTERQEAFQSNAEQAQKGGLSLSAEHMRGVVNGLSIALAAIKAIEEEEAEPWIDSGQWPGIAWINSDGEIERHGAT